MEFRCRLGTPGGEIVEGIYVAEDEARLRREFEEKGLYVLGIQRAGRAALGSFKLPRCSRISSSRACFVHCAHTTLNTWLIQTSRLDITLAGRRPRPADFAGPSRHHLPKTCLAP